MRAFACVFNQPRKALRAKALRATAVAVAVARVGTMLPLLVVNVTLKEQWPWCVGSRRC